MTEQRLVTLRQEDGQYHNFFYTPGSIGSFERHINDGWIVKMIKDDGYMAVILFERTK